MKSSYAKTWKRSVQPRKQRKYSYNAPLHIRQKMAGSHLSSELRKKYSKRGIAVKKGDRVTVMRGQHKKKTGKVESVDLKKSRVVITGIESIKKDGTKTSVKFNPSNLMITELNLEDKKRVQKLEGKKTKEKNDGKESPKKD